MSKPKIQTILINSNYREYGTPSNFEYVLREPIKNVESIVPEKASIEHSEYTIKSYNNTLYWKHTDGTYKSITITKGFYTIDELIYALNISMNSEVGNNNILTDNNVDKTKCNYYWSINSSTLLITIENGGLNVGTFDLFCDEGYNYTSDLFTTNNITNTLGMGGNYFGITNYTPLYFGKLSTLYYDIRCPDLIKNKLNSAIGTPETLIIADQLAEDGSLTYTSSSYPVRLDPRSSTIQRFQVQVFNDNGSLAELHKDWYMVLKLTIRD